VGNKIPYTENNWVLGRLVAFLHPGTYIPPALFGPNQPSMSTLAFRRLFRLKEASGFLAPPPIGSNSLSALLLEFACLLQGDNVFTYFEYLYDQTIVY
jgi:hypothetical protein